MRVSVGRLAAWRVVPSPYTLPPVPDTTLSQHLLDSLTRSLSFTTNSYKS